MSIEALSLELSRLKKDLNGFSHIVAIDEELDTNIIMKKAEYLENFNELRKYTKELYGAKKIF